MTYVDLRKAPEVKRLVEMASGYAKATEAQLLAFKGPVSLDSHWSGGSITHWTLIHIATGKRQTAPESGTPWTGHAKELHELPPGFALVECSLYRGKPMIARVHVHAETLNAMALPEKPTLTEDEQRVIDLTCSYVSSYRKPYFDAMGARYETAKASLVSKGLLQKNGAITPVGRNCRSNRNM